MATELKPCPSCGSADVSQFDGYVGCIACCMAGPNGDPDGAKWNALPRRGDIAPPANPIAPDAKPAPGPCARCGHPFSSHFTVSGECAECHGPRCRAYLSPAAVPPKPEGYYLFAGKWWEADHYGPMSPTDVLAGEAADGQLESPVTLYDGDGYERDDYRWIMRAVTPPTPPAGWRVVGYDVPTKENCDGWLITLGQMDVRQWTHNHRPDMDDNGGLRWILRRDEPAEKPVSDHDALVAHLSLGVASCTFTEAQRERFVEIERRFVRQQEGK